MTKGFVTKFFQHLLPCVYGESFTLEDTVLIENHSRVTFTVTAGCEIASEEDSSFVT